MRDTSTDASGAFAHRRRGRVVLAWVAGLAAVILLAPKGDFNADVATKGSQSATASPR